MLLSSEIEVHRLEGYVRTFKSGGYGFLDDGTFFHINDVQNSSDFVYFDTTNFRFKVSYEKYPSQRVADRYEAKCIRVLSQTPIYTDEVDQPEGSTDLVMLPNDSALEELSEGYIVYYNSDETFGLINDGTVFSSSSLTNGETIDPGMIKPNQKVSYNKLQINASPVLFVARRLTVVSAEFVKSKASLPCAEEKALSAVSEEKDSPYNDSTKNTRTEGYIRKFIPDRGFGFFEAEDEIYFHISNVRNAADFDFTLDTNMYLYKAAYDKCQAVRKLGGFEATNIEILKALLKNSDNPYISKHAENVVVGNETLTDAVKERVYLLMKKYFADGETISLVNIGNLFIRNAISPNTYGFGKLSSLCRKLDFLEVSNKRITGGGTQAYATFHWRTEVLEHTEASVASTQTDDDNAQISGKDGTDDTRILKRRIEPGIHKDATFNHMNDVERKIINALSDVFWVTFGGGYVSLTKRLYTNLKFSFVLPTEKFGTQFNLNKELAVVFNDNVRFDARSFSAISSVQEQTEEKSPYRLERICSLLICKDSLVVDQVRTQLKTVSAEQQFVVVPFSYDEILKQYNKLNHEEWTEFVTQRFREFFYDRDLFSDDSPLKDSLFFFGRSTFVQEIVARYNSHLNSGVFGLRRSGKTSTLYAVQRVLKTIRKKWLWIDAQQLQHKRWNHALHYIVSEAYKSIEIDYSVSESTYTAANASFFFERV
jgi:cold shock CspA family protein